MKYTSAALRKLLADNGIIKSGYTGKLELLLIAYEAGLISREDVVPPKKQKDEPKKRGRPRKYPPKEVDPNKTVSPMYLRLRAIRHNPKTVTITNVETGEVTCYKSLYKAGIATNRRWDYFLVNNGNVVNGQKIEVSSS
jgi:hypothetical protein